MAARKKKRELSEKAQKRVRQRNLHVGITVIAAIVIIFSVIQFTLWRYVSKVDEEHCLQKCFYREDRCIQNDQGRSSESGKQYTWRLSEQATCTEGKDQGADVSIEEMGAEVENIDKLAEKAVGYGKMEASGAAIRRYII